MMELLDRLDQPDQRGHKDHPVLVLLVPDLE